MRKLYIVLSLVSISALFLGSCKKEKNEPNPDSYISFKLYGKQKTFTAKAVAINLTTSGIYSIGLSAFKDSSSTERMYLQIAKKNAQITTGTYIDPGPDSDDLLVVGAYLPDDNTSTQGFTAGLQEDDNTPRFQITITNLTDKNISGTFSGTFHEGDSDGPAAVSAITDGKFNLPLYVTP